jgi:hypothetical protein
MNSPNEDRKQTGNLELPTQQASACGVGCACNTPGASRKIRWLLGVIVLVAAGALVVRAVIKNHGESTDPASTGFAALAATGQPPLDLVDDKEIGALSELNAVAGDTVVFFVFVPGKTEATAKAPTAQIRGAARTIEPHLRGGKIGIFKLKANSRDYEQLATQMAVPGVLAMVKGCGMSAISGDITETKLVQGFVAASRAGGCGPTSGGCGPSGCN